MGAPHKDVLSGVKSLIREELDYFFNLVLLKLLVLKPLDLLDEQLEQLQLNLTALLVRLQQNLPNQLVVLI